ARRLLAAGTACLRPSATMLMPLVLNFRGPVQAVNCGYVVLGAGMLLAAPLVERLTAGSRFRRGMLLSAIVALVAAAAAVLAPREELPPPPAFDSSRFFTDIRLAFAGLTMLL